MTGYDYAVVGYPLPFIEYSLTSKAKELKIFRLYGAAGVLDTYRLKKDGQLCLKGEKTSLSGHFTLENPLIEYKLQLKDGVLVKVGNYTVKSNPAIYGISQLQSRYLIQSQMMEELDDECLRISQAFIKQIFRLKKSTPSPYMINALKDMMFARISDMRNITAARNITLYDLILFARTVNGKLNLIVDMCDREREDDNLNTLFAEMEFKEEEKELLRKHFVQVMQKLEQFFDTYEVVKKQEGFTIDGRVLEMLLRLFDKITPHVQDYRNAQRRIPLIAKDRASDDWTEN